MHGATGKRIGALSSVAAGESCTTTPAGEQML